MTLDDAPVLLRLMNEPSYHRNIGDRGVRTLEQCRAYIENKFFPHYDKGMGVFTAELLETGEMIGFGCLLKRDLLECVDVGYAFLPEHWSQGFATETATALLEHARDRLGLRRLGGIVSPENTPSIRVLEKLGMSFVRKIRLSPEEGETLLYERTL